MNFSSDEQDLQVQNTIDVKILIDIQKISVCMVHINGCDFVCADIESLKLDLFLHDHGWDGAIDIFEVSAYDLTGYPVCNFDDLLQANKDKFNTSKKHKKSMPKRRKIVGLKKDGSIKILIKDRVDTEVTINVNEVEGLYIGEWTDRLIEYIIYQITEVAVPTVITYQKYQTADELKKLAIDFALYEPFAHTVVNLTNVEVKIPSAADANEFLSVQVEECKIWNERYHKRRIFNKNKIKIFPFEEVDTEAWIVDCSNARMFYQHKRGLPTYLKIPVTNHFSLRVKHELPKKMPELGLIYTIVDDILDFPEELRNEYLKIDYEDTKMELSGHTEEQVKLCREMLNNIEDFPKLYVNGGHDCKITIDNLKLDMSCDMLNVYMTVQELNFVFTDGKFDNFLCDIPLP